MAIISWFLIKEHLYLPQTAIIKLMNIITYQSDPSLVSSRLLNISTYHSNHGYLPLVISKLLNITTYYSDLG